MEGSELEDLETNRQRALNLLNSMSTTIENVIQASQSMNESGRREVREKYPRERNYYENQPNEDFRQEPLRVQVFDRLGRKEESIVRGERGRSYDREVYYVENQQNEGSGREPLQVRVFNELGRNDESFVRDECGRSYDREVYFAGRQASESNERDPELQGRHKRIDRYGGRYHSEYSNENSFDEINLSRNSSESYYDSRRNDELYDEKLSQDEDAFVYPDLIRNNKKLIRVRIYDRLLKCKRIEKYKAESFFFILNEHVRNSKDLNFIEFFDVRYEDGAFYISTQTFRNYFWLRTAMDKEFACFNLRAELALGKRVTFTILTGGRRLRPCEVERIICRSSKYRINFSHWILKSTQTRGRKSHYNYYVQLSGQKLRRLIENLKLNDKFVGVKVST